VLCRNVSSALPLRQTIDCSGCIASRSGRSLYTKEPSQCAVSRVLFTEQGNIYSRREAAEWF